MIDTVIICAECSANQEIEIVGFNEYLNYCPACGTTEGDTEELTEKEYEQLQL